MVAVTTPPGADLTVLGGEAAHSSDGTSDSRSRRGRGRRKQRKGRERTAKAQQQRGRKQADSSWEGGKGGYVTWPASTGDGTARTVPGLRGTRSKMFSLPSRVPSLSGPNFMPVLAPVAIAVSPTTTRTAAT